jgi:hypothetical protein
MTPARAAAEQRSSGAAEQRSSGAAEQRQLVNQVERVGQIAHGRRAMRG